MNTPIFLNGNGASSFQHLVEIMQVTQKDGSSKILGFTAKGNVYELKNVENKEYGTYLAWHSIASPIWTG